MVVACSNSGIKNYSQLFEFGFEILNSDESRLNPQVGRLKDRNKKNIFDIF